jgi:two-component sensor histidine kinase/type II secretory pathway pseudopilin PulG
MLLEREAHPQTSLPRLGRWQPRPRGFLLAMAILVALIGIALWSLFLWMDHRRELNAANLYAEAALDALEEHVNRLVETNDLLLRQVLHLLAEDGVEPYSLDEVHWRRLRDLAMLPQHSTIVTVMDSAGQVLLSTRGFGPDTPTASVAGAAALAQHRANGGDALNIGPTVFSPADDRPFLLFSRRWQDEGGSFRGVVVAAVRADNFLDFAEGLVFGPRSTVSVIRDDGLILVRRPLTADVAAMRLDDYELFTEHLRRAPEGTYDTISPADGERRIVRYRRLEGLPLIAIAGVSRDEALANWRRHSYQASALVLAGLVAIGGLALVGMRHAAREEEALSELSRIRAHEQLLMREIDHRNKNLLMIIQSLVRQSALAASDKESLERSIVGRIQALAVAHDVLSEAKWQAADLRALAERELRPFAGSGLVSVDGEPVRLPAKTAMTMAMVLHELATNATKYGALSSPEGRVEIAWRLSEDDPPHLKLSWTETGGPPVARPQAKGFGTTLLERSITHELGGAVALDYRPEGLVADIDLPLPQTAAPAG